MVSVRAGFVVIGVAVLSSCAPTGPIETQYRKTGVRAEEWAEIRADIRKITPSPVISCSRDVDSPGRGPVTVFTADHKSYTATKVGRSWHFEQVVILLHAAT
jgi:hypothetical protein